MALGKDKSAWLLPLTFAISGIVSSLLFLGPLYPLETGLLDAHFRLRKVRFDDPPIVVVAVDATSVDRLGDLPWSPETTSRLFDFLARSGAVAIGCDIPLSDAAAKALSPATVNILRRRLVLADDVIGDPYDSRKRDFAPARASWKSVAAGTGVAYTETLRDGVCRLQPLVYDTTTGRFPAFELSVAQVSAGGAADDWSATRSKVTLGNQRVPTDRRNRLFINFVGGARTFPFIPAYKALNGEISPAVFNGKIVLIGTASPRLQRDVATPTALSVRMPEIEIHANAIHTILTNRHIRPIPAWLSVVVTTLVAVGMGVVFRHQGSRRSIYIVSAALVALAVVAHFAFVWFGVWFFILGVALSVPANFVYTVLLELRHLSRTTEDAIVRMAAISADSGFRGGVAASATEFWTSIAQSVARFLTVDSMVFLERPTNSSTLRIGAVYPESAKPTLHLEHHDLHSEPYSHARAAPVIYQKYVKNQDSDSWVVPLSSGHGTIGFWVLSLVGGRQYFERNGETIRYFTRQIELELIKRQIPIESDASTNNVVRRFIELYRRHVRADEMMSLTESIVEERIRFVASINSLADGLYLYDLFGRCILFNESGYQLSRGIIDDLRNSPLHEVIYRFLEVSNSVENPEETRSDIVKQIERVIRAKEGSVYLLTIGDEEPKRFFQCMLTAIEDTTDPAASQVIGVACVLNDISMFSNVADYSGLVQTISERGRNLLTPILGLVPLLGTSEDLSASQRYALEMIRRNADELAALFDEFRDAPSMGAAQEMPAEIPSELDARLPVDLVEIVHEVAASRKQSGEGRVRIVSDESLVEKVWGNRQLLRGAVESLIALIEAFVPPDGRLDVSVEWTEGRRVCVTIAASSHIVMSPLTEAYMVDQLAQPAEALVSLAAKPIEPDEFSHLSLPQIRHIVETLHSGTLERVMDESDALVFVVSIPSVV